MSQARTCSLSSIRARTQVYIFFQTELTELILDLIRALAIMHFRRINSFKGYGDPWRKSSVISSTPCFVDVVLLLIICFFCAYRIHFLECCVKKIHNFLIISNEEWSVLGIKTNIGTLWYLSMLSNKNNMENNW